VGVRWDLKVICGLGRGKVVSWVVGDFKIIGGNFRGGLGQVFFLLLLFQGTVSWVGWVGGVIFFFFSPWPGKSDLVG